MTQDRFRLHPDFRLIGPEHPGGNAAALGVITRQVAAGQSFAITARPALRIDPLPDLAQDGPVLSCQTSGSTGQPKRILRAQGSWIDSFQANRLGFDLVPGDRYAILGSLASSLCSYAAIEAMHVGAGMIDLCGASPAQQLRGLREAGASVLYCSPAQLRLLVAAARGGAGHAGPALRHLLCGGGKLDAATLQAAAALWPDAYIREFYGAAETSFITISDPATPPASVGRTYAGTVIEIRDAQGQRTDGPGEIWVRSPYLFLRYAEGPAGDTRWQDGFLTVGEMGQLDARGWLYLKGRRSRMVTVADQNVFPEDIEQHLLTLPGIAQCAVLPLPDQLRGQHLVALVEGAGDAARARHIRLSCRDRLGAPSMPRRVIFLQRFPMLASGKPDLMALQIWLETSA